MYCNFALSKTFFKANNIDPSLSFAIGEKEERQVLRQ